jgi:hypothetical protein
MGLAACLNAKPGAPEEAYSVPIQGLTRIACLHPEYVPPYGEGATMFDGVLLRDEFPEKFVTIYTPNPHNADWPKDALKRTDEKNGSFDPAALVGEWLSLSAKYPFDSFTAWSLQTQGAWYPLDTSHAHVYDHRKTLERQGYLLTDYKTFDGMDAPRPASKLPELEVLLEKVATDSIHHNSVVFMLLFAPASSVWLLLLVAFVLLYRRKSLFPLLLSFLFFGTVLLGPLIIVRYLYPIMLVAPTALGLLWAELRCAARQSADSSEAASS